ncbi:hypothetical protein H4R34_003810 [Dimargaris verticillata]|uniref:DUF788-domain-containing protein n=1 Tax=Dimargaris verticillata TaxID=2761393 RepID=A0A9W8B5E7_9FUNG|nr:hypothetical protein H4R34_003810 [Dimargaris verticillata]
MGALCWDLQAKNADKKLAAQNSKTLQWLTRAFFGVNSVYVFVQFVLGYGSVAWSTTIAYTVTFAISLVIYWQLMSMGQTRHNSQGELVSGGEDLSMEGLTSYMFDILYITWLVHLGSLVSSYFWYLYWLIPGFFVYKVGGYAVPLLRGLFGSSSNAQPAPAQSNSAKKREKRQNKPKYSRH